LGARRDVNLPTLALLWLLPENQRRLELERKGERTMCRTSVLCPLNCWS
jgi:hypothetical protein